MFVSYGLLVLLHEGNVKFKDIPWIILVEDPRISLLNHEFYDLLQNIIREGLNEIRKYSKDSYDLVQSSKRWPQKGIFIG